MLFQALFVELYPGSKHASEGIDKSAVQVCESVTALNMTQLQIRYNAGGKQSSVTWSLHLKLPDRFLVQQRVTRTDQDGETHRLFLINRWWVVGILWHEFQEYEYKSQLQTRDLRWNNPFFLVKNKTEKRFVGSMLSIQGDVW